MGRWLKRHCFSPLRRRGAKVALVGTFAASADFHAYLFASVDWLSALSWATFFMVQPLMLLLERGLGVRYWPLPLAHRWTTGVLLLLLPLLLRPFLFLFHTSL